MEQHRIDRLKRHQRERTLIRGAWTKTDDQGRELVCLLFALAPEVGPYGNISACPSSVMPLWLARLTPWIDDAPSDEAWEGFITRYAELASRWHVLDEEDWKRLDYAVRAVCLREAMRHTQDEKTLGVCRRVLDLCDREAQGERVDAETRSEAEAQAKAQAEAQAERTEEAVAWAAEAAVAASASASTGTEQTAAWAARAATAAAAADVEAMEAAMAEAQVEARAAEEAKIAADRLVAAILDTVEQAVNQKT